MFEFAMDFGIWLLDPNLHLHLQCYNRYLSISAALFTFAIYPPQIVICKQQKMQQISALTQRRLLMLIYLFIQINLISRSVWVHSLNKDRLFKGEFYTLYPDLCLYQSKFFAFYQMSVWKFDYLLKLLSPHLKKKNTNYWCSVSTEQILCLTLRWVFS